MIHFRQPDWTDDETDKTMRKRVNQITLTDGWDGTEERHIGGGTLTVKKDDSEDKAVVAEDSHPDDVDVVGWLLIASKGEAPNSKHVYTGVIEETRVRYGGMHKRREYILSDVTGHHYAPDPSWALP